MNFLMFVSHKRLNGGSGLLHNSVFYLFKIKRYAFEIRTTYLIFMNLY